MADKHGDFIWYELMTSDQQATRAFYGGLVGWTFIDSGMADIDYQFFSSGDGSDNQDGVGGCITITPEMTEAGAQPAWVGYIAVDDVDASAAAVKDAGGSIYAEPWDIPGIGRMSMVADPQGAVFYIMKGASDDTSLSFAATEPKIGHCAWNELATSDPEGAKAFYSAQFGWVQDGHLDMGPMGKYEFWKVGDDRGHALGAVMPMMPGMPMSAWTFYFRVPDIDKAVEYIKANGGQILQEPMEIPGGEYSLNAMDPQRAAFGLVGPRV